MAQILDAENLPGPGDQDVFLCPAWRGWSRRVQGDNLWVLYAIVEPKDPAKSRIRFLMVIDTPPIPA